MKYRIELPKAVNQRNYEPFVKAFMRTLYRGMGGENPVMVDLRQQDYWLFALYATPRFRNPLIQVWKHGATSELVTTLGIGSDAIKTAKKEALAQIAAAP